MEALNRNGLIRYLQPKAWGGMELPFVAYYDMPEMLSRGDISVGWTVHNLASHHRTVGWYERKAQEEVWGPNPDVCVASGIAFQQGRGVPVDGGVMLSGEWNFSSGTDHSDWCILACVVRDGDTPIDYSFCLLHRSDYDIVDDWHTLGMRATGSKTVVCESVFVPEHRALSMLEARGGAMSRTHRNAYAAGLVDETYADLEYIEDKAARDREAVLAELRQEYERRTPADIHDYIRWWDEPGVPVPRERADWSVLAQAYRHGFANDHDVLDDLLGGGIDGCASRPGGHAPYSRPSRIWIIDAHSSAWLDARLTALT